MNIRAATPWLHTAQRSPAQLHSWPVISCRVHTKHKTHCRCGAVRGKGLATAAVEHGAEPQGGLANSLHAAHQVHCCRTKHQDHHLPRCNICANLSKALQVAAGWHRLHQPACQRQAKNKLNPDVCRDPACKGKTNNSIAPVTLCDCTTSLCHMQPRTVTHKLSLDCYSPSRAPPS